MQLFEPMGNDEGFVMPAFVAHAVRPDAVGEVRPYARWLNKVRLIGVYRHFESSEGAPVPLENPINGFGHFRL